MRVCGTAPRNICHPACCSYAALLYNGSVHFWHAARPLQRDGLRVQLLPAWERMCVVRGRE
jgi:hypothetical protein